MSRTGARRESLVDGASPDGGEVAFQPGAAPPEARDFQLRGLVRNK